MNPTDADVIAAGAFPELRQLFAGAQMLLERGRARLYSRIPDPSHLSEDMYYDVDLDRAWFEHFSNEARVSFGPVQVVGTFAVEDAENERGLFTWGWRSAEIPEQAVATIEPVARDMSSLEALLDLPSFHCDFSFATDLADYVAIENGYLACYPAVQDETVIFLAIKLSVQSEENFEFGEAGNLWCLQCGWTVANVRAMVNGHWGGLCDACAPVLNDSIRDNEEAGLDDGDDDIDPDALGYECYLCGELEEPARRLVYLALTAVHADCVETAVNELGTSSELKN